jgi:general secretion pathway protein F
MYFRIKYIKNSEEYFMNVEANNFIEAVNSFKAKKIGVFIGAEQIEEPFEIKVEKLRKKLKDIFNTQSKIDMEEYISVLEQIYVMLDASLSINYILEEVGSNIKNKKLKFIINSIKNDIESGLSLSMSIKKFEKDLGKLSVAMIDLGEQTGMLAEAFRDLAEILHEIEENRKKLKSATRYPIFILIAMSIAFSIVILFVIPPFKSTFVQLGVELPLPTRFLLWLEWFLETFGPYILGVSILVAIIINFAYKKYEKVQLIIDKILLKIYIVGSVIQYAMLGRFLYSFEKMNVAGVPLLDSLDTSLGVVDNLYMRKRLINIKNSIVEGKGLAVGFNNTHLFEKMIVQMIASGENSGNLVRMLNKSANYYRSKYLNIVENISTLIEPILIAGIAGFVSVLAFGIFLPMWDMASAVQGS